MMTSETKMTDRALGAFLLANVAYIAATIRKIARRYGTFFADPEIDDMVQEVCARVVETGLLASLEGDDSNVRARTYIGRIAANLATDSLRARKVTCDVNGTDAKSEDTEGPGMILVAGEPDPERILATKEALARVNAVAEETLDGRDLDLWHAMMADEGPDVFDMGAYAESTGQSVNSVRIRKSRVLASMRDAL